MNYDEWKLESPEDERIRLRGHSLRNMPTGLCDGCGDLFHEDDLRRWIGERRCPDCCWLCPVCKDVEVLEENEFCTACAMWALGVEV